MAAKTEIATLQELTPRPQVDVRVADIQAQSTFGDIETRVRDNEDLDSAVDLRFNGMRGSLVFPYNGISDPRSSRADFHQVETKTGDDGSEVIIGTLGAISWIVDPKTYLPVTPGFHHLENLSHASAVVTLGGGKWMLSAESDSRPSELDIADSVKHRDALVYPSFLGAKKVIASKVEHHSSVKERTQPQNLFNLTVEHDPQFEAANEIFGTVVKNIFQYAKSDKKVLVQLQNPELPIRLPEVRSSKISAQLSLVSKEDGSDVIHLSGTDEGSGNEGFMIVRKEGIITIIDGKLRVVATTNQAEGNLNEVLSNVSTALGEYFEGLKVKQSAAVLGASSLHELRANLGKESSRKARRTIKKGLGA